MGSYSCRTEDFFAIVQLVHPVHASIKQLLDANGVQYREVSHGPTHTSEESAAARGEGMDVGAKALVIKIDDTFRLFVLPADKAFDAAAARKHFGAQKSRFATPEELMQLTGLVPGSVPPFGKPILPFDLYTDVMIGQRRNLVAFNAGSLTDSIIFSADEWKSIAKPEVFAFSKEKTDAREKIAEFSRK